MPQLELNLTENTTLPVDGYAGALVGRVWRPELGGPSVVAATPDGLVDVSRRFPDHPRSLRTGRPAGGAARRQRASASPR